MRDSAQIAKAKAALRRLLAARSAKEEKAASCSFCRAKRGERCRKLPSGVPRPPHAERRRLAQQD